MARPKENLNHITLLLRVISKCDREMIKCEACFWLEKVKGIKTPSMPGFNLNTNTDTLLKKDFDAVRGKGPHPLMEASGLSHLRPFWHDDIGNWADSMHFGAEGRFHVDHSETNLRFGGGLDDVWENLESGELHIVDYKSTAQLGKESKPLDESFISAPEDPSEPDYKAGYRRQMDMYQWIRGGLASTSLIRVILFTLMASIGMSRECWTAIVQLRHGCVLTFP